MYDYTKQKIFDYHVMYTDESIVKVRRDSHPIGVQFKGWMWDDHSDGSSLSYLYEYQKF